MADQGDSEASLTYPRQCSKLEIDGYVMLKGRPCKIEDMSTSLGGKHGHTKVHITGVDIFTKKKYEDVCPSTDNMEVPHVKESVYQFMAAVDGYMHLAPLEHGDIRTDLKLPENDFGKELVAQLVNGEIVVTVAAAVGEEHVVSYKTVDDLFAS